MKPLINSDTQDINGILQPLLQKYELPALAAVVISKGAITSQGAVGVRRFGTTISVTIDDQFHIGSCGKAMIATVIAMLVEQGKLNWTTTLADIYPELKDCMLPKFRDVTMLQLLSHHGGLASNMADSGGVPPGTTFEYWWGLKEPLPQQRYMFTKGHLCQPDGPEVNALPAPGAAYLYSNAGYVAAAAVTEKVTVLSWEELITTMLFQPLGMTTAGFGPMGIANQLDQPWQHLYFEMAKYLPQSLQYLYSGEKITPVAPNTPYNDLPPVFRPAGLVHVSLKDWAKFIIMHLEGEQGGSKLLKPETFKILHTPPFDKGDGYALGWDVKDSKLVNAKTLWHSGSNMVSHAEVFAVPERDFAVLIATNIESPGTIPASSDALIAIIDKFFKAK